MTDAQVIGAWQQFRKAMGSVDSTLAATLAAADSPNALVHEAVAALAAAPNRMVPMSELATRLGVSTGGVTKLVDRLVHLGFAYRHPSALDRRVIFAALTDDGATFERHGTERYATGLRDELAVLGSRRLAALREVCTMIEHRFPTPTDTPTDTPTNTPGVHAPPAGAPHRRRPAGGTRTSTTTAEHG